MIEDWNDYKNYLDNLPTISEAELLQMEKYYAMQNRKV